MNLNINQWKEFKVSSIFSIHNGKCIIFKIKLASNKEVYLNRKTLHTTNF